MFQGPRPRLWMFGLCKDWLWSLRKVESDMAALDFDP